MGIRSDFDGVMGQLPEGMDSPADLPKITAALMSVATRPRTAERFWAGMLMRVFREVEETVVGG